MKEKKSINNNILFFNLKKDIKRMDLRDVEIIPYDEFKNDKSNNVLDYLSNKKYSNEIIDFYNVITNRFNKEDLKIFYNNISFLDVKENDENKQNNKNLRTVAYYKPSNNTIYLCDKDDHSSIYHELFHMSTAIRVDKQLFFGFEQCNLLEKKNFGKALNEGYTQLLSERYFNLSSKDNYEYFVHQLLLLEEIVGRDKMERLYMNANLYGLIDELKKYAYYEDIERFITYFDYILKNIYVNKPKFSKRKLAIVGQMFTYINFFIIHTYLNKIKLNKPNTEEEYDEMIINLKAFLDRMLASIYITGITIDCSFMSIKEYVITIANDLEELQLDYEFYDEKKLV